MNTIRDNIVAAKAVISTFDRIKLQFDSVPEGWMNHGQNAIYAIVFKTNAINNRLSEGKRLIVSYDFVTKDTMSKKKRVVYG